MRMKFAVGIASLALAAFGSGQAYASTITMDPDGAGPLSAVTIDLLDPAPGNGISIGLSAANPTVGTVSTFLYQANLSIASLTGSGIQFANNVGGADAFTFIAGITEELTSVTGSTFNFGYAGSGAGATNFFQIWADDGGNSGTGNDLTGANFSGGTKVLVLAGTFLDDGSFSGAYTSTGLTDPLDQFNTNNYPGISTDDGNGTFQGNIDNFTFVNPLYFPNGLPASLFFQASSQLKNPYNATDPSACFFFFLGAAGQQCSAGVGQQGATLASIGSLNGVSGPNTMLQTDGNIGFVAVNEVPEPATLTLLGVGLLGSAAARRRQLKNKKQ